MGDRVPAGDGISVNNGDLNGDWTSVDGGIQMGDGELQCVMGS